MNIAIVGSGYVGLVTGACFAEIGVNVTCVDVDWNKIEKLKQGEIPIYEPGLKELVQKNQKAGRLDFTTSLESVLDKVQVIFSAVGTPPDEDGSADLKYVLQVARTIGRYMTDYKLFVTKSTVPVGTAESTPRHSGRVGRTGTRHRFRCGLQSGIPERRQRHQRFHEPGPRGGRRGV